MRKKILMAIVIALPSSLWGSCLDFYYVKRPVSFGLVIHEYLASEEVGPHSAEVYGLLKGTIDLSVFKEAKRSGDLNVAEITFLGSACDENAVKARKVARDYSKVWEESFQNPLLFYPRMLGTPILGKPCRNVALEIAELLTRFLR
ncbi:MAG: hypothetical protein EXR74_09790 [Bdellovibrionales bacterium]|nr:hypothetical protein [Bdellovibrionales bacterium]